MRRLANGTQVTALPTPAAAVGTPGFGTNGDPAAGLQASIFDAEQYNRIQEEIVAPILAAGIALDGNNNAQLLAALRVLFAVRQSVEWIRGTAGTYSFTVPAGVFAIRCRVWGGGGGGGAGTGGGGGGGGGGGIFSEGVYAVTPGQVLVVTVGAGGATTNGAGNSGGSSSVGGLILSPGGTGGGASSALNTPGTGAPNTTVGSSGGQLILPGSGGQNGWTAGSSPAGGMGGGSPMGGPPTFSPFSAGSIKGNRPGGGASGGAGTFGEAGADGLVSIEY